LAYAWLFSERVAFVPIQGEPLGGAITVAWPTVGQAPGLPAFLAAARSAAAEAQH